MPVSHFPQCNNLNHIRLILAFAVMAWHLAALSGMPSLHAFLWLGYGARYAVQAFFIVSGFLVYASYERSSGTLQYLGKRIRRIYPGYAFSIVFFTLVLSLFSAVGFGEYFSSERVTAFLVTRLLFLNNLEDVLPGLFSDHVNHSVNGALWTLQLEVLFYALVPIAFIASKRCGHVPILLALYVCSATFTACYGFPDAYVTDLFLRYLRFFTAGALMYPFFGLFMRYRHRLLCLASVTCAFLIGHASLTILLFPACLAIFVMYAAFSLPCARWASTVGDLSYGVYICHFPIIQMTLDLVPRRPFPFLVFSLTGTILYALFSWHVVEKRFLHSSSHYVRDPRGIA